MEGRGDAGIEGEGAREKSSDKERKGNKIKISFK